MQDSTLSVVVMIICYVCITFQKMNQLSKAAGRRTARYMVNEFWEAFDHDAAAPHIKVHGI